MRDETVETDNPEQQTHQPATGQKPVPDQGPIQQTEAETSSGLAAAGLETTSEQQAPLGQGTQKREHWPRLRPPTWQWLAQPSWAGGAMSGVRCAGPIGDGSIGEEVDSVLESWPCLATEGAPADAWRERPPKRLVRYTVSDQTVPVNEPGIVLTE